MKNLITIMIIGTSFFTGNYFYRASILQEDIKCIEVIETFPRIYVENRDTLAYKFNSYDTSKTYIYSYKDMEMFQIPYNDSDTNFSQIFFDSSMIAANHNSTTPEKKFFYFIFHIGQKEGIQIDGADTSLSLIEDVSKMKAFYINNYGKGMDSLIHNSGKLISSTPSANRRKLNKVYHLSSDADDISGDAITTLSYDSELANVDFTLNKSLDTVPGMKLYKIVSVNKARYIKKYNLKLSEATGYVKFQIKKDFDRKFILELFEKFQSDSDRLFNTN